MKNLAFIDGQNLYFGTLESGQKINYKKLKVYLKDKYKVCEAYYFIGYFKDMYTDLYFDLQ